jgi:hypothetical protein
VPSVSLAGSCRSNHRSDALSPLDVHRRTAQTFGIGTDAALFDASASRQGATPERTARFTCSILPAIITNRTSASRGSFLSAKNGLFQGGSHACARVQLLVVHQRLDRQVERARDDAHRHGKFDIDRLAALVPPPRIHRPQLRRVRERPLTGTLRGDPESAGTGRSATFKAERERFDRRNALRPQRAEPGSIVCGSSYFG